MSVCPSVDINLISHNNAATIGATIDSLLAQTWPELSIILIDNCSTDGTLDILRERAGRDRRLRLVANRCNVGQAANCQRAFWFGQGDFVMPKSADDLIAPDFVAKIMRVLLGHPDCAMCHAAGLVFNDAMRVEYLYPPEHALNAVGDDPLARAGAVMSHYTSAPSFWGIYRRAASEQLSSIRQRAGWDHVLLAELALYGEIRHVPEVLFWRRGGGAPVLRSARASTEQAARGLPLDGILAEQRWRTPLITTAYGHIEAFAVARLDEGQRVALMAMVPRIFRARWLARMRHEAKLFRRVLPDLIAALANASPAASGWSARALRDGIGAIETILPEEDFSLDHLEIAALAGEARSAQAA
jgi:hypothetical protein